MRRLLPSTLAGRIILVLLVGLMAFHVGSLWLHQTGSDILLGSTQQRVTAERVAAAARAVGMVPPEAREAVAQALSSPGFQVRWQPGAVEGTVAAEDLTITGHREAQGTVGLPEGGSLWYHADPLQAQPEHATLLSTTALAVSSPRSAASNTVFPVISSAPASRDSGCSAAASMTTSTFL